MNLDMRRGQIERMLGVKLAIPVYYITQLVAMACGESPENVGVNRHFVEAVRQITHLPSETTEAVACGAETDAGE
jgi:heterodisulfide reductase subunit B